MEQSNGPRSPGGIPISSRIVVPEGPSFDPVRRALAAIDAVHGDGNLPILPVVRTRATTEAGAYEWSGRSGTPLRLRLSSRGDHPELTAVHEIGHFLDHHGFGRLGGFASESGRIAAVMEEIRRSAPIQWLVALRRRRSVLIEDGRRRVAQPVDQDTVKYYLLPREQFARAYAQYVAQVSQSPVLSAQLLALRRTDTSAVYHSQWEDGEFEPIKLALDRLFWRRRWVTFA
jgi:hypothetical protein